MKRFHGAVIDLGGTTPSTADGRECSNALSTPAIGGTDGDEGGTVRTGGTWGTGERVAPGGLGEGALDALDCALGRALAEARLQNKASREVKIRHLSR